MTNNTATHIYIVRHGQTDWNVQGKLQGQLDIPLNACGQEQAQLTATTFSEIVCDAIYSSDLLRAKETAQAIANQKQLQLNIDKGLRERHFGQYQGFTFEGIQKHSPEDAKRWQARDLDFIPGVDGESLSKFSARVIQAVHAIAQKHMGQNIILVTHGGVLDVVYRAATKLNLKTPRTWALGNASIGKLLWHQNDLSLLSWGESTHLGETALEPHGEPTDTEPRG